MGETNELAMIFSEEQVGPYKVKSWTLKQWVSLYPYLQTVFKTLQDAGCTWVGFDEFFKNNSLTLVGAIVPVVIPVLAVSLDIPEDEVGALEMSTAVSLAMKVFSINIEHLKNFFGQLQGETLAGSDTPS